MKLKFLDFMAGLCMTFDVDWNRELPDDEYCLEKRPVVVAGSKKSANQPAVAAVGRAG